MKLDVSLGSYIADRKRTVEKKQVLCRGIGSSLMKKNGFNRNHASQNRLHADVCGTQSHIFARVYKNAVLFEKSWTYYFRDDETVDQSLFTVCLQNHSRKLTNSI